MAHTQRSWREAEFVNVREAAEILRRSRGSIYDMMRRRELNGVIAGGRTLVAVASIVQLLEEAPAYVPSSERRRGIPAEASFDLV
ncbi:helix-turn-helix protein [Bosea sp. AK1]|uniref:helix-turn-helix domain-containing protein n=1 Tax=Bosea sp. AK1 TaxID=2587160 RepID=UPI00114F2DED|nr:helix-turn-helix domain-containing protein [Bosea sp. AK1]TQI75326.1 helix-turn-helix protein [Bosea sp. AK1]